MPCRNTITPNINVPAQRGWCLKYVDDGINAPARKPSAKASYDQEKKNGNITFDLPVNVWLAGYLAFTKGAYTELGHVFWIYQHSDGRVEIHDSESASGARKPYGSLAELLAWFGAYAPQFIGYTHGIDGVHLVEWYEEPAPTPEPTPEPQPGIQVGSVVVPTRLVSYDGVPLTQWDDTYTVTELIGDRAVLSARGAVWSAMRLEDIRLA